LGGRAGGVVVGKRPGKARRERGEAERGEAEREEGEEWGAFWFSSGTIK